MRSTVLVLTLLAPVLLAGGVLLAEGAQGPGRYDPVAQTISTLAGRGATDRWLMTGTLLLLGVLYVLVALRLRPVPRPGRAVLGLGGVAVVVVALAPQPAAGSSGVHMAAMVTGCVAFALWPLAAVRRDGPGLLRRSSPVASAVMLGLLGWLCAQAWTDGTWLGVAERVLLLAETTWPACVGVALWRDRGGAVRPVLAAAAERAALPSALLAPVVLITGFVAAEAAQERYDPITQSVSTLAGRGATDRWLMVGTLLLLGVLYLLVAAGMRSLPTPARLLLGLGGATVVVAALAAQPVDGSNPVHMGSAVVAWLAFVGWPLALTASAAVDPRLRRASAVASGLLALLVVWFAVELWTDGPHLGLAQRVVLVAQTAWPVVVALRVRPTGRPGGPGPAEVLPGRVRSVTSGPS